MPCPGDAVLAELGQEVVVRHVRQAAIRLDGRAGDAADDAAAGHPDLAGQHLCQDATRERAQGVDVTCDQATVADGPREHLAPAADAIHPRILLDPDVAAGQGKDQQAD